MSKETKLIRVTPDTLDRIDHLITQLQYRTPQTRIPRYWNEKLDWIISELKQSLDDVQTVPKQTEVT